MLPDTIEQALRATASIAYTEVSNLAQDLALPEDEYPLAQILEVYDDDICPLCAWLNGRIIKRGTPEWEKYRLPSHINCRRAFAYIPADVDEQPDFEEPPPGLLQKHGHFHVDPLKYEELRAPAFADRRQFVFRRVKDPETGAMRSVLQWLAPREGGDAERYLIDSDLIRPGSRLANILASLPRRRPNKALQELAEQLDAVVDGLRLGRPIHQSINFRADLPPGTMGVFNHNTRIILINREQSKLLREIIEGGAPSTAHLDAVSTIIHELIHARSPRVSRILNSSREEQQRIYTSAFHAVSRVAEDGLVELWARRLLKEIAEHSIGEESEGDYFRAYNHLVQGWRYLEQHAQISTEIQKRWFFESDNAERVRLLNRYIQQAIRAHFESLSPSAEETKLFESLLERMGNPDRLSEAMRQQAIPESLQVEGLVWFMVSPAEPSRWSPTTAQQMIQQIYNWLR